MNEFLNILRWISDFCGLFDDKPAEIKYTADELKFSTSRELNADEYKKAHKALTKRYSDLSSGYLVPVFEKPDTDMHIKTERCKCCGQNESDYTYINGKYKCNYCGVYS